MGCSQSARGDVAVPPSEAVSIASEQDAALGAKLTSQMRHEAVRQEGVAQAVLGAKLLSQMRTEASRGASEEAIVGGESSEAVLGAKLLSRMRKDNTVSRCESAELRWADRDSFCVTSACAA